MFLNTIESFFNFSCYLLFSWWESGYKWKGQRRGSGNHYTSGTKRWLKSVFSEML